MHIFFQAAGIFALGVFPTAAFPSFADPKSALEKRQVSSFEPGFNAALQRVSTTGSRAWVAPKPGDFRGPCPGLNAAANHGYIPHNGYVTASQATTGLQQAYGMSPDLGGFLAGVAAFQAGDGLAFSIGGPLPPGLFSRIGLLGTPKGLSYSHNQFEGDGSPTRGDLYQFGDAYTMQLQFFKEMLAVPVGADGNYDLDALGKHSVTRYRESVSQNPYYLRTAIGFLIPPGTLGLIACLFSNKSSSHPSGHLSASTLKSFFSVTGDGDGLGYTPGHERIPDGFYKRNPAAEYTAADFGTDVAYMYTRNPEDFAFGGNTGTVDSFAGVDVANATGGAYSAQSLAQGNNLACFVYQNSAAQFPDLLADGGVVADVAGAVAKFTRSLAPILADLGCPQLQPERWDQSYLRGYPGWTRFDAKTGRYK